MKSSFFTKIYAIFSFFTHCELVFLPSSKHGMSYIRIRNFFLMAYLILGILFVSMMGFTTVTSGIYVSKKIQLSNLSTHHKKNLSQLQFLSQNLDLLEQVLRETTQNNLILQQLSGRKDKKNNFGIGGPDVSPLKRTEKKRKTLYQQNPFLNIGYSDESVEISQINIDFLENFTHLSKKLDVPKEDFKEKILAGGNSQLLKFFNKKKGLFQMIPSHLPLSIENEQYAYEILEKKDHKKGIFIRVSATTHVLASSSGVVENIQSESSTGRYSIVVSHKMGLKSEYHNLSSCNVSPETFIRSNQILGTVDSEILYRIKLGSTYVPAIKYLPVHR